MPFYTCSGVCEPEHFEYIVLDESHHGAAGSYRKVLEHFKPQISLGLTATPERMDGVDILADFNNRIAYEIRLREAIDRNLLCPFHYFGVSDETDLSQIKWQSGHYDLAELGIKFIGNEQRKVLLFVREERSDAYGNTEVYRLLGLAKYISHQGSAPISITYKLDEKMPNKRATRNIKAPLSYLE